jgi:L-noviosyl transferase
VRVLFTTLPQVGHMFPMVPLAWALRCAGDQVLVATPAASFAGHIIGAGLPVAVIGDVDVREYARASVITDTGGPLAADLARSGRGWAALGARSLKPMRELVADFRPDLVVSEPAEYAGRVAAERAGVRWAEHCWGLPYPQEYTNSARAEFGWSASPVMTVRPSPPGLWPAGTPDGVAMRYIPYHGSARRSRWPAARQPRILLTFGSLLVKHGPAEKGELFRKLLCELSDGGFELLVGIDPELAEDFRPFPPGVLDAGWVPVSQALEGCDLVVHHGGAGTAMSALTAGIPQVILPNSTDQFITAAVLADSGVAVRLPPEQALPAAVRDAAAQILADPGYLERARALARTSAVLPGPVEVAALLRQGQGRR